MKEIAKIINRSNKDREKADVEGYDEAWDKFKVTLSEEQYDLFLELEGCYLELMEIREINAIAYVLQLIDDDFYFNFID